MTSHHIAQRRLATPLGPMTAARSAHGLSGLWFDGQKHHPGVLDVPVLDAADPVLDAAVRALQAYFGGRKVDLPPLDPSGTEFQRTVWRALLAVKRGASACYGELAAQLGRARAARAVGAAVGRNPISILVPCHRVLGSDGALTGYAGGLDRKRALLTLEGLL
jgi:methylated-DNA-[protein]-cysteine S-methyltransferase